MAGCCGHDAKFDGVSDDYKRRLWIVIALNATMFAVEMTAGHIAKSQALQADALDFAGDAMTYGISLAVIGASLRARTNAALFKGFSLMLMGLWVFGSTVYRVFLCRGSHSRDYGCCWLSGFAHQPCQRVLTGAL